MRVCLVHGDLSAISGSARYIVDLADRLVEDRHDVTIVCHEANAALDRRGTFEIIRLKRPHPRLWRLGHVAALVNVRNQVVRQLGTRRFDALIGSDLLFLKSLWDLHDGRLRFLYTPFSMIAPIEIASYELGGFREWAGIRVYRWLQRWALEHCTRIVRFTGAAVHALEEYYGVTLAQKALVAVYTSREFDSANANEATPASFDRPNPRQLLWVGRLIKSKNVAFLLRAAALMRSKDWVLNICSEGPERDALMTLASSLGLDRQVRFLGAVDDMAAVYRDASLLLTGSVLEQYSLTIMEAYAFGVPCIGLRPDWKSVFNSNEEQIIDGVTGYVVGDEAEMASRVDLLIGDEAKRHALARAAFDLKRQRGYTFESFYAAFREAL